MSLQPARMRDPATNELAVKIAEAQKQYSLVLWPDVRARNEPIDKLHIYVDRRINLAKAKLRQEALRLQMNKQGEKWTRLRVHTPKEEKAAAKVMATATLGSLLNHALRQRRRSSRTTIPVEEQQHALHRAILATQRKKKGGRDRKG
jgi:hypothetical protein